MLKIERTETAGWDAALRGMRNPKNSWCSADSEWDDERENYIIGPNDMTLAQTLAKAGTDHGKYLRMITVYADITAPLYWLKELDTYKVGTVANSCSTMHKISSKEFVKEDFSLEHLTAENRKAVNLVIFRLNEARNKYIKTGDKETWWQMIQLLPSSYNQRRTVMLNYAVLRNIYHARKAHKLDEWHDFCRWIESLPYADKLIVS